MQANLRVQVQRKKMNEKEFTEVIKCKNDPWYFIKNYVKTQPRGRPLQPFPDYPYLQSLIYDLQKEKMLIILKSRQMLVTWAVIAYFLWETMFVGNCDNGIISKREEEAKEAIDWRAQTIYNSLPDYLKCKITRQTRDPAIWVFGERNSRLLSFPSSPDAVRMYTFKRVMFDEMAFCKKEREIWTAIKGGLEDGYFVGASTPNGAFTKHAELCSNASKDGYKFLRLHYSLNPDKDKKWKENAMKGMSHEEWEQEQELNMYSSSNLVYDKMNFENIIENDIDYSCCKLYRGIDFGYYSPVVLWGCLTAEGKFIIFNEWVGYHNTVGEMISSIKEQDEMLGISENDVDMTFCDPAGAAKNDEGISPVEKLMKAGIKVSYRNSSIMTGINIVREKVLAADGKRMLLFSSKCEKVLSDIKRYKMQTTYNLPKKDGNTDHTMDTLRYMIVNIYQGSVDKGFMLLHPKVMGVAS